MVQLHVFGVEACLLEILYVVFTFALKDKVTGLPKVFFRLQNGL